LGKRDKCISQAYTETIHSIPAFPYKLLSSDSEEYFLLISAYFSGRTDILPERFFEKITRALVENGNIREEEEEVYQYALKSMLRPTLPSTKLLMHYMRTS